MGVYERTDITRQHLKEAQLKNPRRYWLGKKHSEETKRKIGLANRGRKKSLIERQKLSDALKGKKKPPRTKEHCDKISKTMTGVPQPWKAGKNHYLYGGHPSIETRIKMHQSHEGKHSGKNSNFWRGGDWHTPYGLEFNHSLKEIIRDRDGRKCFICNKSESESNRKLCVHHIDYDKNNNCYDNLISLCLLCHIKTNFDREYWINYFKKIYEVLSN